MTPLRTGVAAGLALFSGWAVHEGLARVSATREITAPTSVQIDQAKKNDEYRAKNPGSGDVITPLNVRDPSMLVMGVYTAPIPECPAPAPCDCTEEKLKKTGRSAPERF